MLLRRRPINRARSRSLSQPTRGGTSLRPSPKPSTQEFTQSRSLMSQMLSQKDVEEYVDGHLNLSTFAKSNKCQDQDIMCVFQKLMCHKMFRHWNQWQSLLLHRYFWNMQLVETRPVVVRHMHLKKRMRRDADTGGDWMFSWGNMTPDTWPVTNAPSEQSTKLFEDSSAPVGEEPVIIILAELWEDHGALPKKRCSMDEDGRPGRNQNKTGLLSVYVIRPRGSTTL